MESINGIAGTELVKQMQQMAAAARGDASGVLDSLQNTASFGDSLQAALSEVNRLSLNSADMKNRYAMGDDKVTLVDAMIAKEKAGLAFEATLQVRNKLVQAYQDIMNMPI